MGNPQFTFDGKTLDFPFPISLLEKIRESERTVRFSSGNKVGSIFESQFDVVEIEADPFRDREFYRDLFSWWAWAGQGEEYGFALDKDDKIDTTLDGATAAGQKVIPLTSTTDIQTGKNYKIFSDDFTKYEIVKVASISAGVSVTVEDNLVWDYASGDFFQSEDFWPKVVSLDDEIPTIEVSHGNFEFKHEFREVK